MMPVHVASRWSPPRPYQHWGLLKLIPELGARGGSLLSVTGT